MRPTNAERTELARALGWEPKDVTEKGIQSEAEWQLKHGAGA